MATNNTYLLEKAEELAINYDELAHTWFKSWKKSNEQDELSYKIYREKTCMCYAMLELLDECQPFFHHYIFNGKVIREQIA